jgi:hypothetical protein
MTTVVLADDQELVRSGFRLILELAGLAAARRSSSPDGCARTSC